jgi:hypothetical protein
LPVALSLRRHVQDAVGVDVEGDLDLRHAARRRRDPVEVELADGLVVLAIGRSPWSTWTSTDGWLSAAVEKISLFLVGIVVLRGISVVITPPSVSMPSDSGVTSSSTMSLTSPARTPALDRRAQRDDLVGVDALVRLLAEELLDLLLTSGMRVEPPTSTTSSISDGDLPASSSAFLQGSIVRSTRSPTSARTCARESFISRCFGPALRRP